MTNLEKQVRREKTMVSQKINVRNNITFNECLKERNSHLIYACKIWGQNQNNTLFEIISNLQEKAFRIINFKWQDTPTDPLFKENKILKSQIS